MTSHRTIRHSLYDYVRKELPPADRIAVERHVDACPSCREILAGVRAALASVGRAEAPPSSRLPDAYWSAFADRLEDRFAQEARRRRAGFLQRVSELLLENRGWAIGAGCAAVLAGVFLLTRPWSAVDRPPSVAIPVRNADLRAEMVFRRSKVLLVALDNLPAAPGVPLDLSTERNVSRELIAETRALRGTRIDPRSAIMMRDLERVLIGLANTDDRAGLPQMELVRNAVRRENLLFRLRMAAASADMNDNQ